ncbi:MAG: serine hydrolase domain-containing protein [Rhizomicrobium sp.]
MFEIDGTVAPGFEAARAAFAENFAREGDYQEVGASFAAFHRGRCVVDLWGGYSDSKRSKEWTRTTLANVWSSTKGISATAAAILVDRGALSYEDPVARYWPEFAQNGKAGITVAHILSHQAGLPGFVEPTSVGDQCDWDGCTAKLARQKPSWAPGTASSYHAMTYGWLIGEVVRRAAGKTIGRVIAEEIARPLSADLFVGLPETEDARAAEMIPPRRGVDMASLPLPDVARMAASNPVQDPLIPNTRAWRAAEIPAANGQAGAMGLARLYAALAAGGTLDGVTILSPQGVLRMTTPVTSDGRKDMFLGFVDSWGMGMAINTPGIYGPNPRAFGHSGWGGSFGCADPAAQVAIGYVCNQMGPDVVGDPRTEALCRSVLESAVRIS